MVSGRAYRARPETAPGAPPCPAAGLTLQARTLIFEPSVAVQKAIKARATVTEVRRVTELTMTLPVLMTGDEIDMLLEDDTRPGRGNSERLRPLAKATTERPGNACWLR